MRRAIELSAENVRSGRGGPFGAVVVHNGRVVGEGLNSVTSANDPTAHAEVVAIREACRSLSRFHLEDCQIYASCEPCPMCMGAIDRKSVVEGMRVRMKGYCLRCCLTI
jgi:guanine deaminase